MVNFLSFSKVVTFLSLSRACGDTKKNATSYNSSEYGKRNISKFIQTLSRHLLVNKMVGVKFLFYGDQ